MSSNGLPLWPANNSLVNGANAVARAFDSASSRGQNAISRHPIYGQIVASILVTLVISGYVRFGYREYILFTQHREYAGSLTYWTATIASDLMGMLLFVSFVLGRGTRFWAKDDHDTVEEFTRADLAHLTSAICVLALIPFLAHMPSAAIITSLLAIALTIYFRARPDFRRSLLLAMVPFGVIATLWMDKASYRLSTYDSVWYEFSPFDPSLPRVIQQYCSFILIFTIFAPIRRLSLNGVSVGRVRGDVLIKKTNSRVSIPLGSSMAALLIMHFFQTAVDFAALFTNLVLSWV